VSLVNIKTGTAVVGCKRLIGVNLCWAEDVVTYKGQNYRKGDITTLIKKGEVAKEILDLFRS
jgi:hypothetical protein